MLCFRSGRRPQTTTTSSASMERNSWPTPSLPKDSCPAQLGPQLVSGVEEIAFQLQSEWLIESSRVKAIGGCHEVLSHDSGRMTGKPEVELFCIEEPRTRSPLRGESPLISPKGVSGPCDEMLEVPDHFSFADYMDTIARGGPVVVPNVLLFREIAPH